jgi:hypothetical protein
MQGESFLRFDPACDLPSVKAAWWPQRHRTRVERGTGNERLDSALARLIGGIGSVNVTL